MKTHKEVSRPHIPVKSNNNPTCKDVSHVNVDTDGKDILPLLLEMNDADVMSSAYAAYAHNLSSLGLPENSGLIEQLQSFLKTNGLHNPSPAGSRKLSSDNLQGMDTSSDRDTDVRPACRFCGKTFAQASYIKAHERLHTGEKPYVCSVCNKAFSDASNWKKHERMHTRQAQTAFEDGIVPVVTSAPPTPEPLTPATPNSPILTTGQINSTVTNSTLSSQISFAASISQMSATTTASSSSPAGFPGLFSDVSLPTLTSPPSLQLAPHLANISSQISQNSEDSIESSPPAKRNKEDSDKNSDKSNKEESLSCNICEKMFATPASLSMHKKIHSGERPHICMTCGKSFTQIGTLRAHERVHTGEKPYECTVCGKTFAQCGSFRMHERRHHRDMMENLQKCFVCGAGFHSVEDLQKHMLCHPGAFSLNFQNLHPGAGLGFPGPLPLSFGFPPDFDGKGDLMKHDTSDLSEIEKAFSLFAGQSKHLPTTSMADHFQLPPFVSTAHALIQRSLSQGNDPNTAVSMLLSNGAEGLNLLGQPYGTGHGMLSPARLPLLRPERAPSTSHDQSKVEEIEPVSTTTRSRKYSSDSHTSVSMNEGPMSQSDGKAKMNADDDQDGENDNDNDGSNKFDQSQKTPSEDSSFTESRSNDEFQSDDQQNQGVISRKNLNKRLISSANLRKQRRPMRRLSTSAILDQNSYQQQYNEDGEELSEDQLMVSFLLSKGEVYKCQHCHIIFEDCTLYLLHNGFHSSDTDPFKCVICKKCCEGRVEFNCHLTSHIK